MKLQVRTTGNVIRVTERRWEGIKDSGKAHLYKVLDPVPQPEIKKAEPKKRVIEPILEEKPKRAKKIEPIVEPENEETDG